jgi:RNA polymerase sigma factor (sigma-70 family)
MDLVSEGAHKLQAQRRDRHESICEDLDVIYSRHADDLRRIVRSNLRVSDDVLDDACQFAWSTLLVARHKLAPGVELRWLVTTATREALRLMRVRRGEMPCAEPIVSEASGDSTVESVVLRGRLAEVKRLSHRQQQIIWLHGLGYEYREISAATGATPRTIERQLMKARRKLKACAN